MKKLSTILLAVVCLCSACQTRDFSSSKGGDSGRVKGTEVDSAALYQEMAYREMFADSLQQAEQHAYRAFLLSRDSTLECGALSLLCYIYYREGKQQDLQLLLQTISPEAYMDIMDVQLQVEQATALLQCGYCAIAADPWKSRPVVSPSHEVAPADVSAAHLSRQGVFA